MRLLPPSLLLLAACSDPISPSGYDGADRSELAALVDTASPTNVQGFDAHQVDVDGITSHYATYVSSGAAGQTPVPVVFMFHGTGQGAEDFFDQTYVPGGPATWGWVATAEANDFIVVFPQALKYCYEDNGANHVTTKWASGALGTGARELCTPAELGAFSPAQQAAANHPLRDDVAFFDEMLAQIQVDFAVDTDRIYVAGFSNGGQMASRLSVERSTVIAAGSGSGCSLEITPVAAARPMSFAYTVGSKDDRFTDLDGDGIHNDLPLDDPDFIFHPVTGAPMVLVDAYLTAFSLDDADTFVTTYDPAAPGTWRDDNARWTFATSTAVPAESNALTVGIIEGMYHQYANGVNHPMNLSDVLWSNLFVYETL